MRTIIFVLAGLIFGAIVVAALRHRNSEVGEPYYASQMDAVQYTAALPLTGGKAISEPATPENPPFKLTAPAVIMPGPVGTSDAAPPTRTPAVTELAPANGAGAPASAPSSSPAATAPAAIGVRRLPEVLPPASPSPAIAAPAAPEPAPGSEPSGGSFLAKPTEAPASPSPTAAEIKPPAATAADTSETPAAGGTDKAPGALADATADEQAIVFVAGRAVEFKAPKSWKVYAFPASRELWTVLSPVEIKPRRILQDGLQDGIWITHHVRSTPREQRPAEISAMIVKRLRQNAGESITAISRKERFIDGRPTLLYQFEIPAEEERAASRGMHAMVATHWGIIEMHFIAPVSEYGQRYAEFVMMIDGMKITGPKTGDMRATSEVAPAKDILGVWKARRSRMRLFADGRVEIEEDQTPRHPVNSVSFATQPPPEVLKGKFQAQNDVLFVKWEDGSLLNFRWKVLRGALLLTDHEGQISQLERVLE